MSSHRFLRGGRKPTPVARSARTFRRLALHHSTNLKTTNRVLCEAVACVRRSLNGRWLIQASSLPGASNDPVVQGASAKGSTAHYKKEPESLPARVKSFKRQGGCTVTLIDGTAVGAGVVNALNLPWPSDALHRRRPSASAWSGAYRSALSRSTGGRAAPGRCAGPRRCSAGASQNCAAACAG